MDTTHFRVGRREGWREVERALGGLGLRTGEADELRRGLTRHQALIHRLSGTRPRRAEEEDERAGDALARGQKPPPRQPRRGPARGCPIDDRPWPHDRTAWQEHHKQIKRRHGGLKTWAQRTPEGKAAWIEMMNRARLRKRAARRLDALPGRQRDHLVRTLGLDGARAWAWANRKSS